MPEQVEKQRNLLAALKAEAAAIEEKRTRDLEEDRERKVQMEEDAKALEMAKQAGDDQSKLQIIQAQAEVAREREKREKAEALEAESRNSLIEANLKLKEQDREQDLLKSQLQVAKMLAEEANEKVIKLTAKFDALEAATRNTQEQEAETITGRKREIALLEERLKGLQDTEKATRMETEALQAQKATLGGEVSRLQVRGAELREEMERSTKKALQNEESSIARRRQEAAVLESKIEGKQMKLAELEATQRLSDSAGPSAGPSPAMKRVMATETSVSTTPGTPNQTFYTPPEEDKNATPIAVAAMAATPATDASDQSDLSPIERRKSRLLALRKRLADQYGSPNAPNQPTNSPVPTATRTPGSGKDGEKSFDDLVNVCIRLREELDEQRSALLAEFSSPAASPEKARLPSGAGGAN